MIGILGGMGTQAGLDFCNKLAILYRGKIDQEYPLFLLFNKSNIPGRPESIGVQTKNLSNRKKNKKIEKKYSLVLKSLLHGCNILKKREQKLRKKNLPERRSLKSEVLILFFLDSRFFTSQFSEVKNT